VRELYREAFETQSGRAEPKLWALVTLRWGRNEEVSRARHGL
jgi:hypothetical protein